MADIARLAGVSVATVSRALSGSITTIHSPVLEAGAELVAALLQLLNGVRALPVTWCTALDMFVSTKARSLHP